MIKTEGIPVVDGPDDLTWVGTSSFSITGSQLKATHLTFAECGISVDLSTGKVKIPEGLDLDEASRQFWNAVEKNFGT